MEVTDWSLHWRRHTPGNFSTDVLLDVNPQEALPHRDVSTERPHLPGAKVVQHPDARTDTIAHLEHLYKMRTHPELFFESDVDTAIAAWQHIARTDNRGLYDCHVCKITWTILFDADTCPAGHPILED